MINAICVHVEDGDTFRTRAGSWIRLANVCCPEKGSWGWVKAKNILTKLILNNAISYEKVGASYGRIVANVWLNGRSINAYMRRQSYTCP